MSHDSDRSALLATGLALAGVGMLSLMDAFMKGAAMAAGAYSVTVLRSAFAFVMIGPAWALIAGRKPPRAVMKLHLERGIVSAFMALTFFFALTKLPIAEAIALSFVAPLIALYLAALLLGEVIRREAIVASLLGLAGTLVIVGGRLGREGYSEDTIIGMAALFVSAVLYAYNFIVIRRQSQLAGPAEIATFHSGVSALVLALAAPWFFTWPQPDALQDIAIAGVLTIAGGMAIAAAYARAQAQTLVPLEYSGFVWAALFGWLFFKEAVTLPTLAGTALIVAGCLIAAPRRRRPAIPG